MREPSDCLRLKVWLTHQFLPGNSTHLVKEGPWAEVWNEVQENEQSWVTPDPYMKQYEKLLFAPPWQMGARCSKI